jgi:hypothetical protein
LGEVTEIWVLQNQSPLCEVPGEITVGDGDLHPPILLIVCLHMPVDFHRAHVPCAVESIRLLLVVHTHAAAAAYVWQIRVSCVPEPTTKHNQRKEMKRKRKEKKNKKSKRRKTSCGACQSKSLEAASTTNNVKSELMNVCSSS